MMPPWLLPLSILVGAVAFPLATHVQTVRREQDAVALLDTLRAAQSAFRAAGAPGFATDLASLQSPCPGATSPVAIPMADVIAGHVLTLRAARNSRPTGVDCHGRPTTDDYYASVAPATDRRDGRRAFAMTSQGTTFVFFDGIAPSESDMETGGLATPLAALESFRIP